MVKGTFKGKPKCIKEKSLAIHISTYFQPNRIMCCYLVNILLLASLLNCQWCWVLTDIDLQHLYEMEKLENENNSGESYELENDDELNSFVNNGEMAPEDLLRLKFNLIYPGTKWCGAGNISESYDDLGTSEEADKCCRDHDTCPDVIGAGETKHNLKNKSFHSKLSCKCDEEFRLCLRKANTKTAKRIGLIYFNIIGTSCYRKDFLATGCAKRGGHDGREFWNCVELGKNPDDLFFFKRSSYQHGELPTILSTSIQLLYLL